MSSNEKKNFHRQFYQTIMTMAFFLDHNKYQYISRFIVYVYMFDWMIFVSNNNCIIPCLFLKPIYVADNYRLLVDIDNS